MDVERRIPHAVSSGLEEYLSVAASADGRRLVATVANPDPQPLDRADLGSRRRRLRRRRASSLPAVRAAAPRFGPDYLVYLLVQGRRGRTLEVQGRLRDGALERERRSRRRRAGGFARRDARSAFVVRREGRRRPLRDGRPTARTRVRSPSRSMSAMRRPGLRTGSGSPSSPTRGRRIRCSRCPSTVETPVRLVDGGVISNPVWSPDGRFILYSEGKGGHFHQLRGVTPDKQPFPLPRALASGTAGNRYRFLPDGKALVVMQGDVLAPELLAARPLDRAPSPAHGPEARIRDRRASTSRPTASRSSSTATARTPTSF